MIKFLLVLCWVFSLYGDTECEAFPFLPGPIEYAKTLLKINRCVGHIVAEITPTNTVFHYFEFTLPRKSKKKKKVKLIDMEMGTYRMNVADPNEFQKQAVNAVHKFKEVVDLKPDKISVSAFLAEELQVSNNTAGLCEHLLDAFKLVQYDVRTKKCLVLNTQSKLLLMWFLLNGGFQKSDTNAYKPMLHLSYDLAGVAFPITSTTNLTGVDPKDIFKLPFYPNPIYASGTDKLGIDQATVQIFRAENEKQKTSNYKSHCLFPGRKYHTETSKKNYTVTGNEETHKDYDVDMRKCLDVVKKVIGKYKKPVNLPGRVILSASVYYTRPRRFMVDEEWRVDLNDVFRNSLSRCFYGPSESYPTKCMEGIYAYALLTEYFRFPQEDEILNYGSVLLREVHWTLSVAYLNIFKKLLINATGPNVCHEGE